MKWEDCMLDRLVPFLARYRLPKEEFFLVEPYRDTRGRWCVKYCAEGDPARLINYNGAMKLVVELRCIGEDGLAKRVEKVASIARRYALAKR
jgi:hypothetical protein